MLTREGGWSDGHPAFDVFPFPPHRSDGVLDFAMLITPQYTDGRAFAICCQRHDDMEKHLFPVGPSVSAIHRTVPLCGRTDRGSCTQRPYRNGERCRFVRGYDVLPYRSA